MPYTVYAMSNADDTHIYIGSTKNYKGRCYQHMKECKGNRHKNRHIQALFNQIGRDGFEFDVVEEYDNKADALKAEQRWVDYYKAAPEWQLMNIATENVDCSLCNPDEVAKRSILLREIKAEPIYVRYQDGTEITFKSGIEAAKHIGVSRSHLSGRWLKGTSTTYTKPKWGCIAEIRKL